MVVFTESTVSSVHSVITRISLDAVGATVATKKDYIVGSLGSPQFSPFLSRFFLARAVDVGKGVEVGSRPHISKCRSNYDDAGVALSPVAGAYDLALSPELSCYSTRLPYGPIRPQSSLWREAEVFHPKSTVVVLLYPEKVLFFFLYSIDGSSDVLAES